MTASEAFASPLAGARRTARVAQSPAEVVVEALGLTKSFAVRRRFNEVLRHPLARPRANVLRDVSFHVHRGELFGILGLNGAGKTTLLKILATMLLPDQGSATIEGFDIGARDVEVRSRLAMITADERSLHWRLSATENLRLFAGLHRLAMHAAATRIVDVLGVVGLADTGEKMVGAFSSGMRQRLLVARALLARPKVLLLDEPTRSLDPVSAHDFRLMLRDTLIGEHGVTVVLATHNAEEAFSYCGRVLVLHRGTVAAEGTASELGTTFGQVQYRAWTSAPTHPCFTALDRAGVIRLRDVPNVSIDPGVTFAIDGDGDAAAGVLRRLVSAGVPISRFERVPVALSSLISRIVTAHDALPSGDGFNA